MDFLQTAIRWHEKAITNSDSYDKFISIWISFNAIYGQVNAEQGGERYKIKSVIRELRDSSVDAVMMLPEVDFFCRIDPPISGNFFNTSDYQSRLNSYRSRNPRHALENLLYILNTVRNNLFHGSKDINRRRDVEIVSTAYPIVSKLVEEYLHLDEPFVVQEKKEKSSSEFQDIIEQLENRMEGIRRIHNMIPKDSRHPISILLEHDDLGHALFGRDMSSEQVLEIQQKLLAKYEFNKPELLIELDEVLNFVKYRVGEVIDKGCPKEEMELLWEEFKELQLKYKMKGYPVH